MQYLELVLILKGFKKFIFLLKIKFDTIEYLNKLKKNNSYFHTFINKKSLAVGVIFLKPGENDTQEPHDSDEIYLLVQDPADNSTTSSGLKSKNLISISDLENSVDTELSYPNVSGYTITDARLIYATDSPATTYTDSYEKAESSLYTATKNTRSLGTEASVKGDGKVSFREIICIDEN